MNRISRAAGSTGFGWIRSLLAFRHQNPLARFVSTLLAIAMASLLVVGTGAAYADDTSGTTPTDSATAAATTDPAADPGTTATDPATTTSTDQPTDAPSTSTTSGTTTATDPATTGGSTTGGTTRTKTPLVRTSTVSNTLQALAGACPAANGTPHVIGGFEIDGNTCVNTAGNLDWDTTGQHTVDGAKDTTAYTLGDAERDNPAGWHTGGSSQGKDDITDAWSFTKIVSGEVWTFFGVNRVSDNGTTTYDVELNHLANSSDNPSRPDRTVGDLLLQFSVNGTGPLTFDKAYTWTKQADFNDPGCFLSLGTSFGWCPLSTVATPNFESAVSTDGLFAEGALNLSALASVNGHICTGVFGQMNIRTVASEQHTAALQDFVLPFDTSIPSTCGSIVIHKYADDGTTLVGGAHFTISPDPTPGSNGAGPVTLVDGGAGDADNTADGVITINPAEADTYTVVETQAPTGYLLPPLADRTQTITLAPGAGETATFDFTDPYQWLDLTVDKSAAATYSASYLWSIDKQVASSANGPWTDSAVGTDSEEIHTSTGSGTAYYRVTVTQGAKNTNNYHVTGDVRVKNPNTGRPVTVNLSDSISGATCTFPGGTTTPSVPGDNAFHSYAYDCSFAGVPSALTGNNQATVTWSKSSYPQTQADVGAAGNYSKSPTAAYDFTAPAAETSSTNKTIHVTDTRHTFTPDPYAITWSAEGTQTVLDYSRSIAVDAGTCVTQDNTATITETSQSDTATAKVCRGADLVVTKGATGSFTRTYPWSIHKAADQPRVDVGSDGKATATYQVTVTAGDAVDSSWHLGGSIVVQNPNDWESISISSLADVYSGGGSCTVTGVRDAGSNGAYSAVSFPYVLAKSTTKEFSYDCSFASQPSTYTGTNTATASWDGAAAATPDNSAHGSYTLKNSDNEVALSGTNDWTKTLVNKTVTIVDDNATPADTSDDTSWTLNWADVYGLSGHKTTIPYSIDLAVPAAGTCANRVNTVAIFDSTGVVPVTDADGNDAVDGSEDNSATVKVCNAAGLSISKTATGHFVRTYNWSIEKFINTDQKSQTVHIDGFDHTFSYKVKVTPGTVVDSAWVVSGTITVTNDNSSPDIAGIDINSLVDDPSGTGEQCTFDKGLPDHPLASGETYDVGYSCTLTQKSDTNKATVTWTGGGTADTGNVNIAWQPPTEVDKTIDVYDNKVNLATADKLGTVTWNAEGTPTYFDYTKNLTVPESTAGSCGPDMVNTAWLGGTATQQTDRKDSTTAVICVNAGTWSVSKVNLAGNGPVPTDTDMTYRLTAHKTSGVDPKNVVLTDDLSSLIPYIDTFVPPTAPAGTTVDYNSTTHVLTWTIADLGSTDQSLDVTVHVKADAYGVDLPNLVTSPGSDNCTGTNIVTAAAECKTDNDTPHYTLAKSSDAGAQVMPPYLGADGTLITYTLTVHNDSDAPINGTTLPGATVTDDLSAVLDNATFVAGSIDPSGQAALSGTTLTWTLPEIPAGGTVTLSYQVRVNADQWDQTLTNSATPGDGGNCVAEGGCTTTTVTPPYTRIQVRKLDADTGLGLPGATFTLSQGGTQIGDPVVTDGDGLATFPTKLQPGDFVVTETAAPAGYDLPADTSTTVTVTQADLKDDVAPVQVTFRDPPQGALAIAKAHQERNSSGSWVAGDGKVAFGDEIKYVMTVTGSGPKIFHNVDVTDYVPGYDPADTTTAPAGTKAELESGTASCSGNLTCTVSYDSTHHLLTWHLTSSGQAAGDVSAADTSGNESVLGTVSFVVRMPNIPATSPIQTPGTTFAAVLWNRAYLAANGLAESSNAVTDAANATLPPKPPVVSPPVVKPPSTLPNTGGPDVALLVAGLVLLLGGGTLVAGDRRRRRRS